MSGALPSPFQPSQPWLPTCDTIGRCPFPGRKCPANCRATRQQRVPKSSRPEVSHPNHSLANIDPHSPNLRRKVAIRAAQDLHTGTSAGRSSPSLVSGSASRPGAAAPGSAGPSWSGSLLRAADKANGKSSPRPPRHHQADSTSNLRRAHSVGDRVEHHAEQDQKAARDRCRAGQGDEPIVRPTVSIASGDVACVS